MWRQKWGVGEWRGWCCEINRTITLCTRIYPLTPSVELNWVFLYVPLHVCSNLFAQMSYVSAENWGGVHDVPADFVSLLVWRSQVLFKDVLKFHQGKDWACIFNGLRTVDGANMSPIWEKVQPGPHHLCLEPIQRPHLAATFHTHGSWPLILCTLIQEEHCRLISRYNSAADLDKVKVWEVTPEGYSLGWWVFLAEFILYSDCNASAMWDCLAFIPKGIIACLVHLFSPGGCVDASHLFGTQG